MSLRKNPLVSAVMPAYNHERFVEQAIRSVWAQTHSPLELIVLDDGSRDGTPEIIERLLPDSPIPMKFIRKENEGVCRTLNRGIAQAQGEWILGIASDDFYAPNRVEEQLAKAIDLGPDYGCIHSDAYMVDLDGNIFDTTYGRSTVPPARDDCFLDLVMSSHQVAGGTVMVRADVFRQIGGYDENLASEDFDLHLRLARVTKFGFVEKPLTHIRTVPNSYGQSPERWVEDGFVILDKHRDAIGEQFAEALRIKALRNVSVCLFNGHPVGALRYTLKALGASRRPRAVLHTVRNLAALHAGFAYKHTLSGVVPASWERFLRRRLMRYMTP